MLFCKQYFVKFINVDKILSQVSAQSSNQSETVTKSWSNKMDCPVNPIMNRDRQNVTLHDEPEKADRQYCH